ncbi:hypothetical protein M3Y98_00882000 [Aphelenchoides besseyi]|nr:hypothetical protein M3Y98_00882000 [Aphelenchoides besseyi]
MPFQIKMNLLKRGLNQIVIIRSRATYHQQPKVLRYNQLRKFLYQYPRSPYAFIIGSAILIVLSPFYHFFYAAWVLDLEDYKEYRRHYNSIVLNRARHGEGMYIPFFMPDKSRDTFEYFRKRTEDRRAGKELGALAPPDNQSEEELSRYPKLVLLPEDKQ